MLFRIPNLLTLSRILVIPALIGTFYLSAPLGNWLALVLFALAGITDFFDGWLARRNGQMSKLGRFLDPVADKLLVASAIVMMVAFNRVEPFSVPAAVIIMCREIMVTGLREFLAEIQIAVPVSRLSKWKTTAQMIAIGFLLVGDAGPDNLHARETGTVLLWLAAVLTIYTGYDYLRAGLRHMTDDAGASG